MKEVDRKGGQQLDLREFTTRVGHELAAVKKDNDYIYHDVVPSLDKLTKPGTAQLAKLIEFTSPLSTGSIGMINWWF